MLRCKITWRFLHNHSILTEHSLGKDSMSTQDIDINMHNACPPKLYGLVGEIDDGKNS